MRGTPVPIDMQAVRELHARGLTLKAIALALKVKYGRLGDATAKAGLRFRNGPKPKTLGSYCVNGHLLTAENSHHRKSKGKVSITCLTCMKRPKPESKVGAPSETALHRDHDLTRQILDLCDAREREPRRWVRDEMALQIAALQA